MKALVARHFEALQESCANVIVGAYDTGIVSAVCSSLMFVGAMIIKAWSPPLYIGLLAMGTIEIGHLVIPLAKVIATGVKLPFAVAADLVAIPLRKSCRRYKTISI